VPPRAPI